MRKINLIVLFGVILIALFVVAKIRSPLTASVSSVLDNSFHYSGFFETKEMV